MAVKILHKRSAVQFKNATGAQLELGELGLNYHESGPYLQCKDAAGDVVHLGGVFISSDTGDAPGSPLPGKWWLRGDTLFLYNGAAWVEIGGTDSSGGGGGGGTLAIIAGDGIDATTSGATVTIVADIDTARGLEFVGDKIAAKVGPGVVFASGGVIAADIDENRGIAFNGNEIATNIGTGLAYDADGKIICTVTAGVSYKGTLDVTSATVPGSASDGDLYANTGDGLFSSQWAAVTSNADTTTDASPGDWMVYQSGTWDHIPLSIPGTDLDIDNHNGNTLDVASSTGDDVTIPAASTTLAGLMTSTDKSKLDGVDNSYLRLDAGAPDQTRASGKVTFSALTTHAGGVKVTGGNEVVVENGIFEASNSLYIAGNGKNCAQFGSAGDSSISTFGQFYQLDKTKPSVEGVQFFYSGNGHGNQIISGFRSIFDSDTNCTGQLACYQAQSNEQTGLDVELYGFLSGIDDGLTPNGQAYNFYAASDAPNFFKGDTYIGGNTSRNTFDLWKSTLTEEQQEQLEAGTYAVPANVSLPGDGSFARQWWYDQQTAEDQALIDNGELEYPSRFQAANFVDTFTIGNATAINLFNSGYAEFNGGNLAVWRNIGKSQGIVIDSTGDNTISSLSADDNKKDLIIRNNMQDIILATSDSGTFTFGGDITSFTCDRIPFNCGNASFGGGIDNNSTLTVRSVDGNDIGILSTWAGSIGMYSQILGNSTYNDVVNFFSIDIGSTCTATFSNDTNVIGYSSTFNINQDSLNIGDETTAIGFYSNVAGNTGHTYNFYAAGNAPNYFAGNIITTNNARLRIKYNNDVDTSVAAHAFDSVTEGQNANYTSVDPGQVSVYNHAATSSQPGFFFNKNASTINTENRFFELKIGGVQKAWMGLDSANQPTSAAISDYRVKTNIVDKGSTVDLIKQIKVRNFTVNGVDNVDGFIAHELQPICPIGVFGEKDATEAIGTLADYDGTVLETEVTEPSELEYTEEEVEADGVATMVTRTRTWTPSGTRPVYQGVDQTKLIPLLTKALQECLERIETLEAALS